MKKVNNSILVTGANGQLGSEFRALAGAFPQYEFIFTDFEELSITDERAINDFFRLHQPGYCINCAAFTAVDKAEDIEQRPFVDALNADAVAFLAKACETYHAKFIHISTDYVFDGMGSRPYTETDDTCPVSVYGISKLQGEENAMKYTNAIIFRTAWVYSSYGKNFVKTMMRLMQERPLIKVVNDQFGTPTYAADLALAIMQVITSGQWAPGIYHYSNEGAISWFDFACAIQSITNASCEVLPIPTSDYPTPAKRPAYSVLDKTKIKSVYNPVIPDWKKSLERCMRKIEGSNA